MQQGVSQILQSIWEQDFLKNSYGYRPYKSVHQAVHSLTMNLQYKGYGYLVEADIKGVGCDFQVCYFARSPRRAR